MSTLILFLKPQKFSKPEKRLSTRFRALTKIEKEEFFLRNQIKFT